MKLLCDEGVERQVVERLRRAAHEVLYVAEMSSGISDAEVLELSSGEEAVLVTTDKDFGELVFRQGLVAPGVALLRLHGLSAAEKASVVGRPSQSTVKSCERPLLWWRRERCGYDGRCGE